VLIALSIAWLVAAVRLGRWIGHSVENATARAILFPISFSLLLPAPVADEVVGALQFRAMCRTQAILKIDSNRIKARTVRVVIDPSWARAQNTAIPISYSHFSLKDANTGEDLASYSTLIAKGGWLVRVLGIFDGNKPLLIGRPWCGSEDRDSLPRTFGFILTN
jgi:hypothetical protein